MASHNYGYLTASTISPLLTGKGDTLLKGGEAAAIEIAKERMSLQGYVSPEEPWQGNEATEWGNANEGDALMRYEQQQFVSVTDRQKGAVDGWLSCTPDGYVGKDGLVETKCPFATKVHMGYLLDPESLRDQYNDQCQFQLMLTERKWCDLVSYDPRWKEPLDLVIIRITPDVDWQVRCRSRIEQAEKIITETMEKLCSIK